MADAAPPDPSAILGSLANSMGQSTSGVDEEAKKRARGYIRQGKDALTYENDQRETLLGPDSSAQKGTQSAVASADQAQGMVDHAEQGIQAAQGQYDEAQKKYQEAMDVNLANRVQITNQMNAMDEMSKQIAAGSNFDLWGNASTGLKIGAIVAAALGGAAQAMSGSGTNTAVDLINSQIQQAIMLQRMKLEKNKDDYAMRNTLLGRMMEHTDHIEDAAQKAFITAHQGIAGRIDALKALSSSAQVRANLDALKAELLTKVAAANMQAIENTVGQAVGLSQHAASMEAQMGRTSNSVSQGIKLAEELRKNKALADKEENRQVDRTLLGYHPTAQNKIGGPVGETKSVTKVREAIASHATADKALGDLYQSIGKRSVSPDSWTKLNQDLSKVTLTLKSGQALNMGANFTEMEKTLIEQGVLGRGKNNVLTIVDPKRAQKAVADFAKFWRGQLADSAASIGMEKDE